MRAFSIGESIMDEMLTALATLQREVDVYKAEAAHWRANHESLRLRLQFATQRPDLPVDRIPAMMAAQARIYSLQDQVEILSRRLRKCQGS